MTPRDITTTKPTMRGRRNDGQGTSRSAGKPMTIKPPGRAGRPKKPVEGACHACYRPGVMPDDLGQVYCDPCRANGGSVFHKRMVARWALEVSEGRTLADQAAKAKAAAA